MRNIFFSSLCLTVLGSGFLLLSACEPKPPVGVPQAATVRIISAHRGCQLRGHVVARTYDRAKVNNLLISRAELNVIKNKAAQLGANSVVIRRNEILHENSKYVHVINADAYSCHF